MELLPASCPPELSQATPIPRLRSCYPDKGYTTSVYGYIRSAKQRVECIEWNNTQTGRRFEWEVTINLLTPFTPKELREQINRLTKRLAKEGLDGHWAREVSKGSNLCHYHFLILDQFPTTSRRLKQLLIRVGKEAAFPKSRIFVRRIEDEREAWRTLRYSLKAKVAGLRKDGTWSRDKWAGKRVLFSKGLGLRKVGTFGATFWLKGWKGDPRKSWSEPRIARHLLAMKKAKIDATLQDPDLARLVMHIHRHLGVPLDLARWKVGMHPDSPQVRQWADALVSKRTPVRVPTALPTKTGPVCPISPPSAADTARHRRQRRPGLFHRPLFRSVVRSRLGAGARLVTPLLWMARIPRPREFTHAFVSAPGELTLQTPASPRLRNPDDLAIPLGRSP
jgi:hypothetical protein